MNNLGPEAFAGGSGPAEYEDPGDLIPCGSCDRKFRPEALEKHSRICNKVFNKKRKVFNAAAHRMDGEARSAARSGGAGYKPAPKADKWKAQSE